MFRLLPWARRVPATPPLVPPELTERERTTLVALVENGPIWDAWIPSRVGRDALIARGLAVRVVVGGIRGWTAATTSGLGRYLELNQANSVQEVVAQRSGSKGGGTPNSLYAARRP